MITFKILAMALVVSIHWYINPDIRRSSICVMVDTSVTADEMIPLLAYVIVQSTVPRIASLIYYMQYYRLARMIDGSVYR